MRIIALTLALILLAAALACTPADSSPDAGPDSKDGGPGPPPSDSKPVLDSAGAQVTGRNGADIQVTFSGRDLEGDAAYVFLAFKDASGTPVAAVDLDRNGSIDSEGLTAPDTAIASATAFTGTVTLLGVAEAHPELSRIVVAIEDTTNQRSAELTAAVLPQPVIPLDGRCDPDGVLNRCESPFSCRGEPAICQDAVAPTLTKFAYLRHASGPRILVAGDDPDNDVTNLFVEFLDSAGNPVTVDTDNDENPDTASFDNVIAGASADGAFFAGVYPVAGFEDQVPKVALTVRDVGGRESERVIATLTTTPQRSAGQGCDLRGFDECREGNTCLPNSAGTATTCQSLASAINNACGTAPVLNLSSGTASTFVTTSGQGVFDPPAGCASQDPVNRADALVKMQLPVSVGRLTLSTQSPATTFDTILYVLPQCSAMSGAPLGCNDDVAGGGSTLVLQNVPAGTYTIVVDSWDPGGGTAEVTVTTE